MKNTLLMVFTIILSSVSGFAQTGGHATARIFETQNKKLSRIVLVYETGESEIIPLNAFQFFGTDMDNILIENQKTINKLINDMADKGYSVTSMTTTGEAFLYSFILFSKESK